MQVRRLLNKFFENLKFISQNSIFSQEKFAKLKRIYFDGINRWNPRN